MAVVSAIHGVFEHFFSSLHFKLRAGDAALFAGAPPLPPPPSPSPEEPPRRPQAARASSCQPRGCRRAEKYREISREPLRETYPAPHARRREQR